MIDFTNISYLEDGSKKQKLAFSVLENNKIIDCLADFSPILAGTIPLDIGVYGSDLDIICYWKNKDEFISVILTYFGDKENFRLREKVINDEETIIANFFIDDFEVEILGQNIPSIQQTAFRHMVVEYRVLIEMGQDFRNAVVDLKRKGTKTEPAFAQLLGLSGDPYQAVLGLYG